MVSADQDQMAEPAERAHGGHRQPVDGRDLLPEERHAVVIAVPTQAR